MGPGSCQARTAAAEEPAGGAAEFPEAPPERARRRRKAGWRRRPCTPAPSARSATPSRSSRRANSSARSVGVGRSAHRSPPGSGHYVGETRVDLVPPACRLGLARPRLAGSGGAEPGGHQSTVSQRSCADSHPSFGRDCPLLPLGGRARVCTFLVRTRTQSCRADGILFPCPGKRSDWFGNRVLWSSSPSHKSQDAVVSNSTK